MCSVSSQFFTIFWGCLGLLFFEHLWKPRQLINVFNFLMLLNEEICVVVNISMHGEENRLVIWTNMFCNFDKYIWLFGQINLDWFMWLMHRERHIFVNIGMHVLENLGEAEGGRLVIWTNTF